MSSSVGIETRPDLSGRREVATTVPAIGQVSWSHAELEAHATLVNRTHRPDQPPFEIRLRWLPFPLPRTVRRRSCCASCALDWPCPEVRWAGSWLSVKQRFLRALAHHPGT